MCVCVCMCLVLLSSCVSECLRTSICIRAVETHVKKPRFLGFFKNLTNLKSYVFRFIRFFDFQVRFFTFSCQTL